MTSLSLSDVNFTNLPSSSMCVTIDLKDPLPATDQHNSGTAYNDTEKLDRETKLDGEALLEEAASDHACHRQHPLQSTQRFRQSRRIQHRLLPSPRHCPAGRPGRKWMGRLVQETWCRGLGGRLCRRVRMGVMQLGGEGGGDMTGPRQRTGRNTILALQCESPSTLASPSPTTHLYRSRMRPRSSPAKLSLNELSVLLPS